jgi:nicotinamidase-related amidase
MANVRKYALCLIDLQDEFSDSITSDLLNNIEKEVNTAIRLNRDILVVLYRGCGPLIKEVSRLIRAYPHKHTIWKREDDGGAEVTSALALNPQHVRVCGVNTDACVGDTVNTMSSRFGDYHHLRRKRIQVVRNACWTCSGQKGHNKELKNMRNWARVEVV